jgi:hypothetical protein
MVDLLNMSQEGQLGTPYSSWRCVRSTGNDVQISMRAVCQWEYRPTNAWDLTYDFNSATGGGCWQANLLGGINARAYCQSKGYLDVKPLGSTYVQTEMFGGTEGWPRAYKGHGHGGVIVVPHHEGEGHEANQIQSRRVDLDESQKTLQRLECLRKLNTDRE